MKKINLIFLTVNILLLLISVFIYKDYSDLKNRSMELEELYINKLYTEISELHSLLQKGASSDKPLFTNVELNLVKIHASGIRYQYEAYLATTFLNKTYDTEYNQHIRDLFLRLWSSVRVDFDNVSQEEIERVANQVGYYLEELNQIRYESSKNKE